MSTSSQFRVNHVSYKNPALICAEPTLTKQSFKEECDINTILKKYATTGQLPDLIKSNPQYGDFSTQLSYQDSLNTVLHAQTQFNNLSAAVRLRFNNDPSQFLAFCENPKNSSELVELGLATAKPKPPSLEPSAPAGGQPDPAASKKPV